MSSTRKSTYSVDDPAWNIEVGVEKFQIWNFLEIWTADSVYCFIDNAGASLL